MSYHVPSRVTIRRVFRGDESYFDKAAIIVERWYKLEGSYFDSIEGFLEEGYDDIAELIDAATNEEEQHIVCMALKGFDTYQDIDDDYLDDDDDDFFTEF